MYDRAARTVRARKGAQRLAVTNAGTIPDRGAFGVFLPDGTRVGELDEEMVYESRVGELFLLGASSWRIEDITFERVVVTPAPRQPAKMPFWHGDGPGRPTELGRAVGQFIREIQAERDPISRLRVLGRVWGSPRRGVDGLAEVIAQLQGAPDCRLGSGVRRFRAFESRITNRATAMPCVPRARWCGSARDLWEFVMAGCGWGFGIRFRLLLPAADELPAEPVHEALLAHLGERGASFWPDLVAAVAQAGLRYDQELVLAGLWDLVWAGEVTNDTLAPVRALVAGQPAFAPRTARGRAPAISDGPGLVGGAGRPWQKSKSAGTSAGPSSAWGREAAGAGDCGRSLVLGCPDARTDPRAY